MPRRDNSAEETMPPVTPSSHTEKTHVPDLSEEESRAGYVAVGGDHAALEVGAKGGPPGAGYPPADDDRRRGRPERAARDQGGYARAGDTAATAGERGEEECGRERLKRHRVAMAGRVWIPETWGQESLLKEWVDCAAVDRALVPSGLVSAREALVEEYRRAPPGSGFRIESSCLST